MKIISAIITIACFFTNNLMLSQESYTGSNNGQLLHGKDLRSREVRISTFTAEHFGSYKAFEQFGFSDFIYNHDDENLDIYVEWYPKLDIGYIFDKEIKAGPLSKVLIGGGINSLVLNPGKFFIGLLGPVWQFDIEGFDFLQLETYAYHHFDFSTSYQLTLSWDIPFGLSEKVKLRSRGFVDYIGQYVGYEEQIVAQPQFLLDAGNLWGNPNKLFTGIEWRYWKNFAGEAGITESIPQLEIFYQF